MMSRNPTVPIAEKNSVVAGEKPVRSGTRNVAPNMATTCCIPIPMVRGQVRRSSPGRRRPPVGPSSRHRATATRWRSCLSRP
ncbi:Uncharacterised protein [Mycobacteroides abscessus]|nr:Uncharacterised protein [Mycobacteroides abscessus]